MIVRKPFVAFLMLIAFVLPFFLLKQFVFAAPPANFQSSLIISSGLNAPTGFAFAPDGRIFILERTGKVRIYKNNQLLSTPFVDLPSSTNGDKGLINVLFDPDFNNNHYVYFFYTATTDSHVRIVRYDASGDTASGGGTVIYESPNGIDQFHAGGGLAFGPDGKLYFSIGDNGVGTNSQSLSNPYGKVHRINKDGTIPSDNPFFNTSGAVKSIWAYGLRNPYRMNFDNQTGNLYVGDVGNASWEEIDKIQKSQNYGWPNAEGNCTSCTYVNPIYTYPHVGSSNAITLGPVYRATMFPQEYRGSLIFGDYGQGFIKKIGLDASGNSTGVSDFDSNAGSVVDFKVANDGSLYYLTIFPGNLFRVTYSSPNQAPIAQASADKTQGDPPLVINFSSLGSSDPEGQTLTYNWNFGDGTSSSAANPSKTYNSKGMYTVQLTVSDGTNSSQADPIAITVGQLPQITINNPQEGLIYRAGDNISYSASAVSSNGNQLGSSAFTTEILFHHHDHFHPFSGPAAGNSGQFTIPASGEPSPDTWYEIIFRATDADNLTAKKSVNIFPKKSNFTLQTSPPNMQIYLDGTLVTTPLTVEGVVGFQRELNVPIIQKSGSDYYEFTSWSDGGNADHFIQTPETDTTFTASYSLVSNIAPQASAYRWSKNSTSTSNANQVAASSLNDNNLTADISLNNGADDNANAWEAAGIIWTSAQNISVVDYKNGKWDQAQNGAFTANFKLQFSDDGTAWTDSGWTSTPQYVYDSPSSANVTYVFTGPSPVTKRGVRVVGQVRTAGALSWHVYAIEVRAFSSSGVPPPPSGGANIAVSGTGYRWSKNSISTSDANRVAALQINDDDLSAEVSLNNNVNDAANAWEAAGVAWSSAQGTISSVKFKNGNWNSKKNGAFTANFKLQFSDDGTAWTDSGWTVTPAYAYDSPSSSGVVYTFTGSPVSSKMGVRITGQVRTSGSLSWIAHAIELQVYSTGSPPPPSSSYSAQYFDNQTLSGSPKITRNESDINFDWGGSSPDPQIPNDQFSARFTKTTSFENADYEFTLTADDGVRLYIDNQIILEKWFDQPSSTYKVTKAMTAGDHEIKLEYYENSGGAVIKMSYLKHNQVSGTNLALIGLGYRWSQNTTDTSNSNQVDIGGINDDNLTNEIHLNGGVDDNPSAWESTGVIWGTTQNNITTVKFKNGNFDSSLNGVFSANFKLQFSNDGIIWQDSGWSPTPAYNHDSPSAGGVTYTFTGPSTSKKGVRVVGQVRTPGSLSWHVWAVELQVFAN